MTFDRFEIHSVLQDIETYLGYIKGNELAAEYLNRCHVQVKEQQHASSNGVTVNAELSPTYAFPCPEGQWRVTPHALLRRFTLESTTSDPGAIYELLDSFERGADESWAAGNRWSAGLSAQAYDICQYVIAPDANALAAAAESLVRDVSHKLLQVNSDWASIDTLRLNWTGGGGYSFNKFYGTYADVVASMSLLTGKAAGGFGYAATVVDQTQRGLLEHLEVVRDGLRDDLTAWVEEGQQPHRPLPSRWGVVADVAGIAEKAYYLLDYVPVVDKVKSGLEAGIEFAANSSALLVELGVPVGTKKSTTSTESSYLVADQVAETLVSTLRTDYADAFQKALDQGFSGAGRSGAGSDGDGDMVGAQELQSGWLQDLQMADDWHLPRLGNPGSMYYDGDELY